MSNVAANTAFLQYLDKFINVDAIQIWREHSALSYTSHDEEPIANMVIPFDSTLEAIVP